MNEIIFTQGEVLEILEHNFYNVKLENQSIIKVSLSSKQKSSLSYPIEIGEIIHIELSPYDLNRGRIRNLRHWKRIKPS